MNNRFIAAPIRPTVIRKTSIRKMMRFWRCCSGTSPMLRRYRVLALAINRAPMTASIRRMVLAVSVGSSDWGMDKVLETSGYTSESPILYYTYYKYQKDTS